jgi:hypothetical protein
VTTAIVDVNGDGVTDVFQQTATTVYESTAMVFPTSSSRSRLQAST